MSVRELGSLELHRHRNPFFVNVLHYIVQGFFQPVYLTCKHHHRLSQFLFQRADAVLCLSPTLLQVLYKLLRRHDLLLHQIDQVSSLLTTQVYLLLEHLCFAVVDNSSLLPPFMTLSQNRLLNLLLEPCYLGY